MERSDQALVLVVRDTAGGDVGLPPAEAARRATGLVLGAAGLALEIVQAILNRSGPGPTGPEVRGPGSSELPEPRRQLAAAALGLGLEVQRRSLGVATALGTWLSPPLRAVPAPS